MKKIILVILWLLLSAILPACSAPMTYDEIEDRATAPDATEKDKKRLAAYERTIEKAILHFEAKYRCIKTSGMMWFCPSGGAAKVRKRGHQNTLEETVKDYRKEKWSHCGCADSRQVMDGLGRSL